MSSEKLETPSTFSMPEDPNAKSGATKNQNFWAYKDRSGNQMVINHEKGFENITFEHRTGSKMQLLPDGSVHFKSQNGKYEAVFGENRMMVTGAHDIVVKGGASLKVDGDYNVNVKKNVNLTAGENFNIKSKNLNIMSGCMDLAAKNMTSKIEGGISLTSQQGISLAAAKGVSIISTGDSLFLGGKNQVGIYSVSGETVIQSGSTLSILGEEDVVVKACTTMDISSVEDMKLKTDATLKTQGLNQQHKASGGRIFLKATAGGGVEPGTIRVDAETALYENPTPSIDTLPLADITTEDPDEATSVTQKKSDEVECPKPD